MAFTKDDTSQIRNYLVSIIGNAPYGIMTIALDGTIAVVNEQAIELLGLKNTKPVKLIDTNIADTVKLVPELRREITDGIKRGRKQFDLNRIKAGDKFLNMKGRVLVSGTLLIFEDVTEQTIAEQAIKESEEKYRFLMESITDGVSAFDKEGRYILVNDEAVKMVGLPKEKMLNSKQTDLFPGIEKTKYYKTYKRVLKTRKSEIILQEYPFEDARKGWYENRIHPAPEGVLVITSDVSEQKNAEQEIKKLNQTLEQRVEERTLELEKRNRELQEFSFVAAHDLKAPLTNLGALISMIEQADGVDEHCKAVFEKLKVSVNQMETVLYALNDIIALKETLKDKKEQVNFEEMFNEVKESIAVQLKTAQATLKTDFSKCSEINYPPVHLRSIMQNLLTNAVKFKHADKALQVNVKTNVSNGGVTLTVKDNGLGFNMKEYKDKLFGLFQRLHPHIEGRGVGLYILKSIVDSHGGKIEVKSEGGKGATFKVYLTNGKG